jgi:hypothetical protein
LRGRVIRDADNRGNQRSKATNTNSGTIRGGYEDACSFRRTHHNAIYVHEIDEGGYFAVWEETGLFSAELRAAFR